MVTKTSFDPLQKLSVAFRRKGHITPRWLNMFMYVIFGGMLASLLLLGGVLPLRGLNYSDALLSRLGSWSIMLSRLLFHQVSVISPLPPSRPISTFLIFFTGWEDAELLFTVFTIILLRYLLLPRYL